jgi:hypothetical protein
MKHEQQKEQPYLAARSSEAAPESKPNEFARLLPADRQRWSARRGDIRAILYTDTINDEQTCRDDLWLATTDALHGVRGEAVDALRQSHAELLKAAKRALNVLKAQGESIQPGNVLSALVTAAKNAEKLS